MFEYHNNVLGVTADTLYGTLGLLTYFAYLHKVQRGTLPKLRPACRSRKALVAYEPLPEPWKEAITKQLGDPYKVVKRNALEALVETDHAAISFFSKHTYGNATHLTPEKQREYAANAQLLNAIGMLITNRQTRVRTMGGRPKQIWDNVVLALSEIDKRVYPHTLPNNPRSLSRAYDRYQERGYSALIHKNYENNHGSKLTDESREWVLARWADQVNRCTSMQHLLREYNKHAATKGWRLLAQDQPLEQYLNDPAVMPLWYSHRFGGLAFKEKYIYQHSTTMPTMRDSLWYSDGTRMNIYYKDDNGKMAATNVYEIMDAYSEVFLGYHIDKSENYETQYRAFKMAAQIAGHKPYQLTFDNQGGHKKLESAAFLSKIARLTTRTKAYNGKSKTIESAFGRFQQYVLAEHWYFTGQNQGARKAESKVRMEFILANVDKLPTLAEAKEIYKSLRDRWNNEPHPHTKVARMDMYLSSHNPATPAIELDDMVEIFWLMRPKLHTYRAYGLQITERGQKYNYTVYTQDGAVDLDWHGRNIDREFWVKFDPEDMGTIYLYEQDAHNNFRFVTAAQTKIETARGIQEQTAQDREFLADINAKNDAIRVQRVTEMDEVLRKHGRSADDYGLNTPAVLGVNSSRKAKAKAEGKRSVGKALKAQSERIPVAISNDDAADFNVFDEM